MGASRNARPSSPTILSSANHAKVTTDLWGERWTKLTANTITHGILGATGLDNRSVYLERGTAHRLGIKLAGEAIAVGRAMGYGLGTVLGLDPESGARRPTETKRRSRRCRRE